MRATAVVGTSLLVLAGAATLGADEPARPGTAADARARQQADGPQSRAVRVISAEEIWRSGARNLPELLQRETGLWMTFATYAGGTPVGRGLTGNDLLVLLDGVKINTTAYRYGPIEILSTIDLHLLDRIEIVRGAAGLYGGDTHGPVLRLFTRRDAGPLAAGRRPPDDPRARAQVRYSTVDKATIAHLQAHRESDRYGVLFGLTSRDIGDLRGGEQTNFQRPTGYEETAGSARVQYFASERRTVEVDVQILEQQHVNRFDRLESGSHIDYRLDPRKRALFKIAYVDTVPRSWSERLEASIYLNQHRQRAFQQLPEAPETVFRSSDNNDVEGAQLRLETALGRRHALSWGFDYADEAVSAVLQQIDLLSGEEVAGGPDPTRAGQSRTQVSAWVEDRVTLHPELRLSFGARWTTASIDGSQATPAGTAPLEMDESDVSAFASVGWSVGRFVELLGTYDRGFRLPGIDEVTSFSEAVGIRGVPSSTLRSTAVDSLELGIRFRTERLQVSVFSFRQELERLAVLVPVEVDGLTSFDPDGDGERGTGEPLWVRSESLGAAEIEGFEVDLNLALPWGLDLAALFRSGEGDDLYARTPLAGQPPDFGLVRLAWRGTSDWEPFAEALVRWANDTTRLSPQDLADPSFDPLWLESFNVFEIRGGATVSPRLRLLVALDNRRETDFKRFGSALAGGGRNLVLSAEYVF